MALILLASRITVHGGGVTLGVMIESATFKGMLGGAVGPLVDPSDRAPTIISISPTRASIALRIFVRAPCRGAYKNEAGAV